MPSVDFESLTRPISADAPCGPDLDAEGDLDYLNFFASTESVLPQSYFRARGPEGGEPRLFDPKMLAFDRYFDQAKPFLDRTRDIRLTVLLAKLSILNRDLAGFATCLKALVTLLETNWDDVHPRGEGGEFDYRGIALEAIDVAPTVTMPLHFLQVANDHRLGAVSYRNHLTSTGVVPPAEGESIPELGLVERVLDNTDLDALTAVQAHFQDILGATKRLREIWTEKNEAGSSLSFEQLSTEAGAIARWIGDAIRRRNPGASEPTTDEATGADSVVGVARSASIATGQIKSMPDAVAALAAVGAYYATFEPSSPACLLISLSRQMVGKSFAEVVRILAPSHVEQAVIKVGAGGFLDLPVERISTAFSESAEALSLEGSDVVYTVENRPQALDLIDQISLFFRAAEPSSPIPVLLERIRDLGQRDFLNLLKSVLPSDVFTKQVS